MSIPWKSLKGDLLGVPLALHLSSLLPNLPVLFVIPSRSRFVGTRCPLDFRHSPAHFSIICSAASPKAPLYCTLNINQFCTTAEWMMRTGKPKRILTSANCKLVRSVANCCLLILRAGEKVSLPLEETEESIENAVDGARLPSPNKSKQRSSESVLVFKSLGKHMKVSCSSAELWAPKLRAP